MGLTTAQKIQQVGNEVVDMLIEKNRRYGDSALSPLGVFSKDSASTSIRIRIDDKLARMRAAVPGEDEDIVLDLIGYLMLLRIAENPELFEEHAYTEGGHSIGYANSAAEVGAPISEA